MRAAVIAWVLSSAVVLPCGAQVMPTPGISEKVVVDERAGGFRRSFRLHLPPEVSAGDATARPLVVALHGGFASGRVLEQQTGFSRLADREGFVVVYPNGLGFFGLMRHWNGGYCCAKAMKDGIDDVGFIDRVIAWVGDRYPVDPERIYVVGYSNGGMIAHRYAAERADRLAGLGIWASSIGTSRGKHAWSWQAPDADLAVFIGHGLDDQRLRYGEVDQERQTRLGAAGSARAWAVANRCGDSAEVRLTREGAVERRTWCAGGAEPVVLLSLDGWGHDWPGPHKTDRLAASEPLHGFDLAAEMWTFFSRRRVP